MSTFTMGDTCSITTRCCGIPWCPYTVVWTCSCGYHVSMGAVLAGVGVVDTKITHGQLCSVSTNCYRTDLVFCHHAWLIFPIDGHFSWMDVKLRFGLTAIGQKAICLLVKIGFYFCRCSSYSPFSAGLLTACILFHILLLNRYLQLWCSSLPNPSGYFPIPCMTLSGIFTIVHV